jgi:hypothetical protein
MLGLDRMAVNILANYIFNIVIFYGGDYWAFRSFPEKGLQTLNSK